MVGWLSPSTCYLPRALRISHDLDRTLGEDITALLAVPQFDLQEHHEAIRIEIWQALESVLASQRFVLGPQVVQLEEAMASMIGVRHAVSCASGTDALLLPLRALASRICKEGPSSGARQEGPEVVVPAFTFFATAGAAWNAGLRPVFCDVDPDTFNVSGDTVAAAVTDRTVAVVPVHLFGQMAPVEGIRKVLGVREIMLLEDSAQATGSRRLIGDDWVAAGAVGDAAAFSFFPTKNLGGLGDGGMITTDDDVLADVLRDVRVHGGHEMVGTNSRLDTIQAAVLLAKLPYLDHWIAARRANAALYDELLADFEPVTTPVVGDGNFHTYNQYTIRAERRDELRVFLEGKGIGSGVYYPVPLPLRPCFHDLGYAPGDFPVAEALCEDVLSLPIYPELGEERVRIVAEAVRDFYGVGEPQPPIPCT
jgi:dTDP-4-amino-4,6-dideoxygalactose transaminase